LIDKQYFLLLNGYLLFGKLIEPIQGVSKTMPLEKTAQILS
jgi:hypothetical protein